MSGGAMGTMDVSVAELAALVGGAVDGDPGRRLTGFAGLPAATAADLSFFREAPAGEVRSRTGPEALAATSAGAVMAAPSLPRDAVPASVTLIRVADPEAAFNRIARRFGRPLPALPRGVHPTAVVDAAARIDPTAAIGPFVVVEAGAEIGARTQIGAHGYVGHGVRVGADCRFHPRVVVREATWIGDRVVLEAGAVIGSDGFGWEASDRGPARVPQLGRVVLEDDVEIGANATVDRARLDETRLGRGTKLDNLVHLGHNVELGPFCLLAAQAGLAGTTTLGRGVEVGGQAGFAGHLHVGDGCKIGAQAGLFRDTEPGTSWLGSPAFPLSVRKRAVLLSHVELPKLLKRVKALEARIDAIEATAGDRPREEGR